eukprot:CAMPEP_0168350800 /NCGR_PEP_ID=MMETSP0213-20121227/21398_1 /TAXON_ID=151035 /ORGANISM="Euplotes harpa, Strain FSP1.4" /LENGTH=63 /DNA_ID=CAMNT_0008361343 /DNA_START=3 /DNA_END=191 /DNA_ORIENTATION=+
MNEGTREDRSDGSQEDQDNDLEVDSDKSRKKPESGHEKNKNKKIGQYVLGKSIGEGTFGKVKQ